MQLYRLRSWVVVRGFGGSFGTFRLVPVAATLCAARDASARDLDVFPD